LSVGQAENSAQQFFARLEGLAKGRAGRAAARAAFRHTLKTGDILHSAWGREQTNCDYYQVVALIGERMVEIRPIVAISVEGSDTGGMSDMRRPGRDQFTGPPLRKRVGERNIIRMESYAHALPWDGRSNYCSWYA
jgi:hypothetical protein